MSQNIPTPQRRDTTCRYPAGGVTGWVPLVPLVIQGRPGAGQSARLGTPGAGKGAMAKSPVVRALMRQCSRYGTSVVIGGDVHGEYESLLAGWGGAGAPERGTSARLDPLMMTWAPDEIANVAPFVGLGALSGASDE